MPLGCPIPSCLASKGKIIRIKAIHAAKTLNGIRMHSPGTGMQCLKAPSMQQQLFSAPDLEEKHVQP